MKKLFMSWTTIASKYAFKKYRYDREIDLVKFPEYNNTVWSNNIF